MSLEDDYDALCRVAGKLRERAERAEALADQLAEALKKSIHLIEPWDDEQIAAALAAWEEARDSS